MPYPCGNALELRCFLIKLQRRLLPTLPKVYPEFALKPSACAFDRDSATISRAFSKAQTRNNLVLWLVMSAPSKRSPVIGIVSQSVELCAESIRLTPSKPSTHMKYLFLTSLYLIGQRALAPGSRAFFKRYVLCFIERLDRYTETQSEPTPSLHHRAGVDGFRYSR